MEGIKKCWRVFSNILLVLVLLCGILYAVLAKMAPEVSLRIFPYRSYTIVTDSMVPTIPVGSLVISKALEPEAPIPPDTIITFRANYYGENIVLTHYFRKTAVENGTERYYTQAEGTDKYDDYTTHREDILGTYVCHIPYVGKIAQFIGSIYGLVMFIGLLLIWLINRYLKYQSRHTTKSGGITIEHVQFHPNIMDCRLTGKLVNHSGHSLRSFTMEITLFNVFREEIGRYTFEPLQGGVLRNSGKMTWVFQQSGVPNVAAYQISSKDMTMEYTDISIKPLK